MSWPKQRLGRLFDVQLGKMLSEKARAGAQYPYLANFNVRWGSFDLSHLNLMAFSEKEREKFAIKKGDLLMCEGGEIGRCAVWSDDQCSLFYQKALHRLRPLDDRMNPYFLYYFILHVSTKGYLPKLVGETSFAHLTREKLIDLMVPVPPIRLQNQIVELLMNWDTAIEKTERLIEAKEKQFKGLLMRLISNYRHPRVHIRDFTSEVSKRNSGEAADRVLSVTNNRGFVLPEDQFERRVASSDLSNYKVVASGQYAYNPSRINVGSIARLDGWDRGVLSPMYVVFNVNEKRVNSDFFLHWLSSHEAKERIRKSAQGSVRDTVSFADFGAIPFPLPSLAQQQQIAESLNAARQEIDLLKKQTEAYRKQKRGLMQKLLTGAWRVKQKRRG